MSRDVLIGFLVATALLAPVTAFAARRLGSRSLAGLPKQILYYWLIFLTVVLVVRGVAGLLLWAGDFNLWAVGKFYPIRIAGVNVGLLHGLPYVAACWAVVAWLPRIGAAIQASRWRALLLPALAAVLLLSFGGIYGGLIRGNIGIADNAGAMHDATLNPTVMSTFETHIPRTLGEIGPRYRAPHSTSHPAASVLYWQLVAAKVRPFVFSVINVLIFSLAFPVMHWALRRSTEHTIAVQTTLAVLTIPALLVYGRSDDAVYYAVAAMTFAVTDAAIRENRFTFSIVAGVLLALAMNLSYGSVVLIPVLFSFTAAVRLNELWGYVKRVAPHAAIVIGIAAGIAVAEEAVTGSGFVHGFLVSAEYNSPSTILSKLANGEYINAMSDRVMAICDFPIFGGPLFLFLLVWIARRWAPGIGNWRLKDLALAVLLAALAVGSNGPGEIARPWGSLYIPIMFSWLPELLQQQSTGDRWWSIRAQLGWGLMLQTVMNFGW